MTSLVEFGAQLRAERERQLMFKKALAERAGVHRNTLADLEAGRGNIELKTLLAICELLGFDLVLVRKPAPGQAGADILTDDRPAPTVEKADNA